MTTPTDRTADLLSAVLADLAPVMSGITPQQLINPTPCTELDVAQLRDHVLGWLDTFAAGFADAGGQAPRAGLADYQASADPEGRTAKNADLYFGMGEVVGSGERHTEVESLRKSMALHGVKEAEYDWYLRMRQVAPLRTSGFGMGVERFLMWVLGHGDIRDLTLISRVGESKAWPGAVVRP